jgi:hypothetical protein
MFSKTFVSLYFCIIFHFHFTRSLYAPTGSPFFPGGVTRTTSSKFQPFNPRYRSPNGRSSNQNESQSITPSIPNSAAANTRLSRPISNTNN